jgi:hypothetical protein
MKPYYAESYAAFCSKARELKNLRPDVPEIAKEKSLLDNITWIDLIEITKTETDFLKFISGVRDSPSESIFNQLLERGFIPIIQDADKTRWPMTDPLSSETVLRSGTSWFLWHITAENRGNRGLLTWYSSRYANTPNASSPIADIGLDSPFFDCVLGCVESSFMFLSNRRNFFPHEPVKGGDYLVMLKRLAK